MLLIWNACLYHEFFILFLSIRRLLFFFIVNFEFIYFTRSYLLQYKIIFLIFCGVKNRIFTLILRKFNCAVRWWLKFFLGNQTGSLQILFLDLKFFLLDQSHLVGILLLLSWNFNKIFEIIHEFIWLFKSIHKFHRFQSYVNCSFI